MGSIPQEAWIVFSGLGGAIIGGLITLVITLIQNSAATKRLKVQLDHEKGIRSEDREMALRREIYYGAIESTALAIRFLMNLCEADMNSFSQDLPADLTAKFYKVQLIGGEKVLESFYECSNLISQSIFSLLPQKFVLQNLQIEKSSSDELQKIAFEAHKNINLKMEELVKQKQLDSKIWDSLKRASDNYGQEINDYSEKNTEISKRIAQEKIQFMKDVLPRIKDVNKAAANVIFNMRKELDSKADDKIFKILEKIIDESNEKSEKLFNDFISNVNRMIEEV